MAFPAAVWPQDHRDTVLAGLVVGVVVTLLGFAASTSGTETGDLTVPAHAPSTTGH